MDIFIYTQIYTHTLKYIICILVIYYTVFPGDSDGKQSACSARDPGSIPGSGRSLGEGNGNPLQFSCLGNPMDRGASWATVHGVARVGHDLVTKPPPKMYVIHTIYNQYMKF